jgi:hypothetical protein
MNGQGTKYQLLKMSLKEKDKYKEYIKEGKDKKIHLRAHSARREPWYQVDAGRIPDAFFPYRATAFPYLVLNKNKVQCTNSIHRIYFESLTAIEIKWIQVSLFSVPGQLSLEAYSMVYGGGVLKIEPATLKRSLMIRSKDKDIEMIHRQCSMLIKSNEKEKAMLLATKYLDEKIKIDKDLSSQALSVFQELKKRRLDRIL